MNKIIEVHIDNIKNTVVFKRLKTGVGKEYQLTTYRRRQLSDLSFKNGVVRFPDAFVSLGDQFLSHTIKRKAIWHPYMNRFIDDPMYMSQNFEMLKFTYLSDLRLRIELTEEGKEYVQRWVDEEIIKPTTGSFDIRFEMELLEDALCNGWTLDPDDDGRSFITQSSIDDDGQVDYKPGDMGWFYNQYAIRSWVQELHDKGEVIFSAYYFGDTSLDEQHILAI